MSLNISVIGSGGWGTTLGNLIAKKGQMVKIWSYEAETVESINIRHDNPQFLPGISLSPNLVASSDFNEVIPDADIIIFAVPSVFVRNIANQIRPFFSLSKEYKLVTVAKGLEIPKNEYDSFKLMSEVLRETLPSNVKIAALSGPNLSSEVAREKPTATVIASIHAEILPELIEIFRTEYFKPYGGERLDI